MYGIQCSSRSEDYQGRSRIVKIVATSRSVSNRTSLNPVESSRTRFMSGWRSPLSLGAPTSIALNRYPDRLWTAGAVQWHGESAALHPACHRCHCRGCSLNIRHAFLLHSGFRESRGNEPTSAGQPCLRILRSDIRPAAYLHRLEAFVFRTGAMRVVADASFLDVG